MSLKMKTKDKAALLAATRKVTNKHLAALKSIKNGTKQAPIKIAESITLFYFVFPKKFGNDADCYQFDEFTTLWVSIE